jgi:hypothetical protein
MILPAPVAAYRAGESPGDRIARIVRLYEGCSADGNGALRLAALVGRGVNDQSFVQVRSNCATFALGVLACAGVVSPELQEETKIGAAFSDLVAIGYRFAAWEVPSSDVEIPVGAALWYRIDGTNDDHVEFQLDGGQHGGGGRAGNAVTVETGPVMLSVGRPLYRWLDPDRLEIAVVAAASADETGPHT